MQIAAKIGISQWWLQHFVDQAILWSDDQQLQRYVQFLIEQDLAPEPTGRAEYQSWGDALENTQHNIPVDALSLLDLKPVAQGGNPDWVERDNIPEELWRDTFLALRASYRSLIGNEPRDIHRISITIAIGLLEHALRTAGPVEIPSSIRPPPEPMSREVMLAKGLITPDHVKPEWLRDITGSGPKRHAYWYPADRDNNPIV